MDQQKTSVLEYLASLAEKTKDGAIQWVKANPTTYMWDHTQPNPGKLILQRIDPTPARLLRPGTPIPAKPLHFVFQAINSQTNQQLLTLNGSEDVDQNAELKKLFDMITEVQSRSAIEYLRGMLPK